MTFQFDDSADTDTARGSERQGTKRRRSFVDKTLPPPPLRSVAGKTGASGSSAAPSMVRSFSSPTDLEAELLSSSGDDEPEPLKGVTFSEPPLCDPRTGRSRAERGRRQDSVNFRFGIASQRKLKEKVQKDGEHVLVRAKSMKLLHQSARRRRQKEGIKDRRADFEKLRQSREEPPSAAVAGSAKQSAVAWNSGFADGSGSVSAESTDERSRAPMSASPSDSAHSSSSEDSGDSPEHYVGGPLLRPGIVKVAVPTANFTPVMSPFASYVFLVLGFCKEKCVVFLVLFLCLCFQPVCHGHVAGRHTGHDEPVRDANGLSHARRACWNVWSAAGA